jgi:hypothetical protein
MAVLQSMPLQVEGSVSMTGGRGRTIDFVGAGREGMQKRAYSTQILLPHAFSNLMDLELMGKAKVAAATARWFRTQ